MRARSIKPGICDNELLGTADPFCTLLFERLWMMADREGRLEDRPLRIKAQAFPYREGLDIQALLGWLSDNGFISRYTVGELRYIQVIKFLEHQKPHQNEKPSVIPPSSAGSPSVQGSPQGTTKVASEHNQGSKHLALTPSSLTPDSGLLTPDRLMIPSESVPQRRDDGPVVRVFEHWRSEFRHPKASLDAKRRRVIQRALEAYDEASVCAAIAGYKLSPHHMGQNDQRTVYDDISLFLRDAEHIERGMNFARAPPVAAKSAVELARENLQRKMNGGLNGSVVSDQDGHGDSHLGSATRVLR